MREPVIMSARKARRELRWRPRHDALQTLRETIAAARAPAPDPPAAIGPRAVGYAAVRRFEANAGTAQGAAASQS